MATNSTSVLFVLFFLVVSAVHSNIDHLELIMPKYAVKGSDIILKCDHSVKQVNLHKVEWHKADAKIYRYIKGRNPPYIHWPINGANINLNNSNQNQIHLTNLTFDAAGSYYCMVSIESPSIFTKDSEPKELIIIEPQKTPPNITFTKDFYVVGEELKANCTTSPSRPSANITWLINDEKANNSLVKSYYNDLHGFDDYEAATASTKQLSIEVSQLHVGMLKLTCLGTIPDYVKGRHEYADAKNSTVEIEISEMKANGAEALDEESSNALSTAAVMYFSKFNIGAVLLLSVGKENLW